MPTEPRPAKVTAAHSTKDTSGADPEAEEAQLSSSLGVESDVSSVAMDRGLLAMAAVPQAAPFESEAAVSGEVRDDALSDAQIMLQVKAGDDSAFEFLVQKYRRAMVNFMFRMAHNNAAAEDLAQEVFLRVYRSRESYEASAKFTTWLYRIATNLAVNHARDTRHERPENTVSLDEPDQESGHTLDLPDRTPSAEEAIVRRERVAAIRQRVQA
ncbi:MAG: sigma-70 family RNA polymerase sigma factor, partial [Terriglobales bacterium]